MSTSQKNIYIGISLAVLAAFIWSGNFIIARKVIKDIPPVSLAFYRWLLASVIVLPLPSNNSKQNGRRSNVHGIIYSGPH